MQDQKRTPMHPILKNVDNAVRACNNYKLLGSQRNYLQLTQWEDCSGDVEGWKGWG